MKTAIAALAAVAAVSAVALPAAAQPHRGGWNVNERQERLDDRIDRSLRNGAITRAEAARLRAEFRQIARLEARYRVNGLTRWERADLDRRFDQLAAQIRYERNDRDYGYGYGQRR